ncbi:hypothetical protein ScPMuIL_017725 [Solemya velum]
MLTRLSYIVQFSNSSIVITLRCSKAIVGCKKRLSLCVNMKMDFHTVVYLVVAIHLVVAEPWDTTGVETHNVCPQGWYRNSDPNGEFCLACPDGQTSAWNSTTADACTDTCVPGTYSNDGSGNAPCSPCPVDTYNPNSGSTSMDDCVACGTERSTFKGSSYEGYCIIYCFYGTYSPDILVPGAAPGTAPGIPPCTSCPENTYSPNFIWTVEECRACPQNTTSGEGSWSIYHCQGE